MVTNLFIRCAAVWNQKYVETRQSKNRQQQDTNHNKNDNTIK